MRTCNTHVFDSKKELGFLDGTITKPTTAEKLDNWRTVQSMVCSWLLNYISPTVCCSMSYFDNAYDLWSYLQERYCVSNET